MRILFPVAAAVARVGTHHELTVDAGPHTVVADDAGPTPLQLMTSALAACSVMSARTHLVENGATGGGDIEVTVTLDAGPPTVLHRRVVLSGWPRGQEIVGMAAALERTEVTRLLRSSYPIHTVIENVDQ